MGLLQVFIHRNPTRISLIYNYVFIRRVFQYCINFQTSFTGCHREFLKIVMTYIHVVTKAMLLLCCIQTMDPYSPRPLKKKKRGKGRTRQHDRRDVMLLRFI